MSSSLVAEMVSLVRSLPPETLAKLLVRLDALTGPPDEVATEAVLGAVTQPGSKDNVRHLLARWRRDGAHLSGSALAWGLRGAAGCDQKHQDEQQFALVWTGPSTVSSQLERIDEALLDVVKGAQRELLLVTFAAYRVPALEEALTAALHRGVVVSLILETASGEGGKVSLDPALAFAPLLGAGARRYVWPPETRPQSPQGRRGGLHVKCAVADRRDMVVSSANMTGDAMHLNMELGLRVQGGRLAGRVVEHFEALIRASVLHEVKP